MNETLAFEQNKLVVGSASIGLSGRETDVLAVLMANSGHVVAVPTLVAKVYGLQDVNTPEIGIRVYVGRLRKKLRGTALCILNHHAIGYRIADKRT